MFGLLLAHIDGEDEIVLQAIKSWWYSHNCPRHTERAAEIASLCSSMGFAWQIRSEFPILQKILTFLLPTQWEKWAFGILWSK